MHLTNGKMPEWSIGAVSKTVVPLRVPRVRIPVFPQRNSLKASEFLRFLGMPKRRKASRRPLLFGVADGVVQNWELA